MCVSQYDVDWNDMFTPHIMLILLVISAASSSQLVNADLEKENHSLIFVF